MGDKKDDGRQAVDYNTDSLSVSELKKAVKFNSHGLKWKLKRYGKVRNPFFMENGRDSGDMSGIWSHWDDIGRLDHGRTTRGDCLE